MSNSSIADLASLTQVSPAPDFGAIAAALGLPYLHQRPDGSWAVPSDSTPGLEYTVWLTCPNSPTCTCDAWRWNGHCYHIDLARARGQQDTPNPPVTNPPPAPAPDTDHRYIAALRDELYGDWAA